MFEFAKRMALLNEDFGKFRHGAVLVKHGAVINACHNKNRACSFGSRFRSRDKGQATIHAELGAILNIGRGSTENADMYVIRINQEGEFRNSKPCSMCQEAMKFVGIKRVFYSSNDGTFEMMKL